MNFSTVEIEEFYVAFKAAYVALASGVKAYTINTSGSSRSVTRHDLPQVKKEMIYWSKLRGGKQSSISDINVIPFEPIDD